MSVTKFLEGLGFRHRADLHDPEVTIIGHLSDDNIAFLFGWPEGEEAAAAIITVKDSRPVGECVCEALRVWLAHHPETPRLPAKALEFAA